MSNVFLLVTRGLGWDLLREVFTSFDAVGFELLKNVMGLIFDIAELAGSKDVLEAFSDMHERLYIIISIYMLFKVSISLISYIVNPDSIEDKQQGAGKLVTRIIVALIMLSFFPNTIFPKLMDLQIDMLQDGTIDNIILGADNVTEYQKDDDALGLSLYNGVAIVDKVEGGPYQIGGEQTIDNLISHINDHIDGNRHEYRLKYYPLLGFAIAIVMSIVMLMVCIDVAVRTFKLLILQLLAPIPIISYVDPKSAKDGTFGKWLKILITVWLELFIRLLVIDFVLLAMKKLIVGGAVVGATNGSTVWVKVALIIGLFFFAKDAPKFITNAIGLKPPEKGSFSGIIGKAALGGAAGMAVGAGAGLIAGRGLGGMAAGALNGLNGGIHGNKVADSLKQGLDLGTQVRSGGEETKYKNLLQQAQQKSMQKSAARKLGFGSAAEVNKKYGDYKAAMLNAKNALSRASDAYNNGGSFEYNGRTYAGKDLENLIHGGNGLAVKAAKAESAFNDFSSHVGAYGMGSKEKTSLEKAQSAKADFEANKFVSNILPTGGGSVESTPVPSIDDSSPISAPSSPDSDMDSWDTLNMMSEAQLSAAESENASRENPTRNYYPDGSGDGDDGFIE